MNEQQRKAMELALEALEECRRDPRLRYEHPTYDKTITALKEALAQPEQEPRTAEEKLVRMKSELAYMRKSQPEQEPVAWLSQGGDVSRSKRYLEEKGFKNLKPLVLQIEDGLGDVETITVYTTPPQRTWVGLTTNDWDEIKKQVSYNFEMTTGEYAERISHLVEDRLKEKNTK